MNKSRKTPEQKAAQSARMTQYWIEQRANKANAVEKHLDEDPVLSAIHTLEKLIPSLLAERNRYRDALNNVQSTLKAYVA